MIYYFLLLNGHKNLSLKRRSDYKKSIIIIIVLIVFSILVLMPLFVMFSKENFETFTSFFVPAIIILDFSIRFFLKKNANVAIVPYLTLPIPRKMLIWYVILSDLLHFGIWGCGLIYGVVLVYCGDLTFRNAIIILFFILLNNYLTGFVKALIGSYALLIYSVCFVFVLAILLIINLLNTAFVLVFLALIVFMLVMALFFTLRENLYKELNCMAL